MNKQLDTPTDIIERRRPEETPNQDEEIFRSIAENVDDLIVVLDAKGRRIYNSPSYGKVIGKNEIRAGSSAFNEIHPDDRDRIRALFQRTVETGIGERSEFRFLLKDGSIRYVESQGNVVRDASGNVSRVIVVSRDVTERKKAEEQIHHLYYHDPLTGLPNRVLFNDRLKQAIAAAKRNRDHRLSILFLDLDGFKRVNDTYGHATGDDLLRNVANRIRGCLRESDTAARLGGDEFVVLLPAINTHNDAMVVAEKIRQANCQPIEIDGHRLNISTSIGIAVYPENGREEESLVKNADAAMYRAKESGRNNVCFFSDIVPQDEE